VNYPGEERFPQLIVNYVKLDHVPKFDNGWTPLLDAMRAGDYFVTSGEVLLRTSGAEAEWSVPPEFAKLVWSDGQMIPLSVEAPFASPKFRLPFDAAGKKLVRFAVWDSAGNGALTQPVHLKHPRAMGRTW
jgi:hypothetical protein